MKRTLVRLLILTVGWFGGVAAWIAAGPPARDDHTAEVAIVLGAAVYDDRPSPVFAGRLEHAVDLFEQGRVKRLLLTGGRADGDKLSEGRVGADYAIAKGVPASAIVIEEQSRTTRQNLANAQRMLDGELVLIVSDPLHMRRAMAIAADLGLDARPSPILHSRYRSMSTKLPFLAREVWFMHMHWLFGV